MLSFVLPEKITKVHEIYRACLKEMGINDTLGCDAPEEEQCIKSGEDFFLKYNLQLIINEGDTIFDVGANEGRYAETVSNLYPQSKIYAFEPHPDTYMRLAARNLSNVQVEQAALGKSNGKCTLFERSDDPNGSEMASLYESVITDFHGVDSIGFDVNMKTVDSLVEEHTIDTIGLLKIDVEGSELDVVQGARESIKKGKIKCIQYEFNHPNIESRVFMKDFRRELGDYVLFRLLEKGATELIDHPIFQEIFGYQNIVAVHKSIACSQEYKDSIKHFIKKSTEEALGGDDKTEG